MKMKILFRVLLSTIGLILVFALTDYYLDGAFQSIVYGICVAVYYLYNQMKNLEYEKTKDNK